MNHTVTAIARLLVFWLVRISGANYGINYGDLQVIILL